MTYTAPVISDPVAVMCVLREWLPIYLGLWTGLLAGLIVILLLLWRFVGKAWFWWWDRFIEQHRPVLVFKNYRYPMNDISLPIYGDQRFNFSKTVFFLDGEDFWKPSILKVRRRITLREKGISIRGTYRPRGDKNSVRFDLESGEGKEHKIKGLNDERADFVFSIELNSAEKESI